MSILAPTSAGLYCQAGDFYIDPWRPVDRAIITHAHADHARPGHRSYLTSPSGRSILQARLGEDLPVQELAFGARLRIGSATVSLHPAGHVLGSAQVRVEVAGEVWVVTGDYKIVNDGISEPWEPVPCHTFITESTFGLPVYRWPDQAEVLREIRRWWEQNRAAGLTSVLHAYSLGKAQRLLAGLGSATGLIGVHPSAARFLPAYHEQGVTFPDVVEAGPTTVEHLKGRGLVIAPQGVGETAWERPFAPVARGFASGWMRVRGIRRRQNLDAGFVLSDHADWPGLMEAISATGAQRIGATHGYVDTLTRYLKERGFDAFAVATEFRGEEAHGSGEDRA